MKDFNLKKFDIVRHKARGQQMDIENIESSYDCNSRKSTPTGYVTCSWVEPDAPSNSVERFHYTDLELKKRMFD